MPEHYGADEYRVNIVSGETRICSFGVQNYAEFIKFLFNCKKYSVSWYPAPFGHFGESKEYESLRELGGIIRDYWVEFGDDMMLPCIVVDFGGDDLDG